MNDKAFTIERTFNSPIDQVWEALTNNDTMKNWYFDIADFKPEIGFEFTFSGQGADCENYVHLCKIIEVEINKKLSYGWVYQGYEGYSEVCFELFAEGEKTRLVLTHTGLESFPQNNKDFARDSFAGGWTYIIGTSLHTFLEKQ